VTDPSVFSEKFQCGLKAWWMWKTCAGVSISSGKDENCRWWDMPPRLQSSH